MLRLIGEGPIWSETESEPYARGSKPLSVDGTAHRLDKIMADLNASGEKLLTALKEIPDERLAAKAGEGEESVGHKLAFLVFHEAYHVGQLGLLRRNLGKEGAIR
jgi:uncharacterized damage-inducible protein DinB